ncbi:MAG: cytochrome c biogenesis protein ResB [Thermoguttaceae bacterium]|jgi:hypothetical protein
MASSPQSSAAGPRVPAPIVTAFRWLASLRLAVGLIVVLAAVLAVTTFVEAAKGREYVRWYVYGSQWFVWLLGLLAANILACTLSRYPWKKRLAFLTTHAGLLLLLGGAIQTFWGGIEGQLVLPQGEALDRMVLTDRCQVVAHWIDMSGRPDRLPVGFVFRPGPVDWPEGETLDLGDQSGVRLKVTRLICHAVVDETWVADESGGGQPALRFALAGPNGTPGEGQWLVASPMGGGAAMGPIELEFQRVPAASMLEDFLQPPKEMDSRGVLSIHYQGRMQRIPVGANLGKKTLLNDGKVSVELAEYLPNAQPGDNFRFVSKDDEPKNPLLELRVYLPGQKEPLRQVAFATRPMQSFEGIHGWNCPVKFWYHHPAVAAGPGAQFLQTPDGKLYCRVGLGGKYQMRGAVRAGDEIELPGKFRVLLLEHLPSARREVRYQPAELAGEEGGLPDAALCLEVTVGGQTQEVWLRRDDPEHGVQRLVTPEGPLAITCTYEYRPLGFSLELLKFQRGLNPGGMGEASFTSIVRLIDKNQGLDQERQIAMNQPLAHGKLSFYQSSFDESPGSTTTSTLTVAYDPGRFLKYLGCLMVCGGTVVLFWRKMRLFAGER